MLILQSKVRKLFQGHLAIGRFWSSALISVQICRLAQVPLERLLLAGSKVANFSYDLFLQYCPVGWRVKGNLSERTYLFDLFIVLSPKQNGAWFNR